MTQVNTIKDKLLLLKELDAALSIFGAATHQYKLNPPLYINDVERFEQDNSIKLPPGYVQFITQLGNGGAGPFYGLEPLENALYTDLDYKTPDFLLDPSKPFPHTTAWNMQFETTADEESEEYEQQLHDFDEEYFQGRHMNGAIAICNYGCAIAINLIVNGSEYGNMWMDDRPSRQGILPSVELGNTERISFLDWYERWLDNSLLQLRL